MSTPNTRRSRWLPFHPAHLIWIAAVVAVLATVLVGRQQEASRLSDGQRLSADLAQRELELFVRGDPAAVKELVSKDSDASLLTPAAAKIAFGDNPQITRNAVASPDSYSGTTFVSFTVTTPDGNIPLTMKLYSGTIHASGTLSKLDLPELTASTSSLATAKAAQLSANGERFLAQKLSRGNLVVFPGRLVVENVDNGVFTTIEPVSTALLSRIAPGIDPITVTIPTTVSMTDTFKKEAVAAVRAWMQTCAVTAGSIPRYCEPRYGLDLPRRGASTRNIEWKVAVSDSAILERLKLPQYGDEQASVDSIPLRYGLFALNGKGEWLDGSTWRHLETVNTLEVTGTLRKTSHGWEFHSSSKEES